MKKYLLCLLLTLALTACGSQPTEQGDSLPNDTETILEETDKDTDEFDDTDDSHAENEEASDAVTDNTSLYCYDSDEVHFEILSINPDAPEGYEMKILYENKVADCDLNFALEEFAVQRYLSNTFVDSVRSQQLGATVSGTISVDPLSTKEFSVYLDWNTLNEIGITTIDEISFNFRVWNWDYLEGEDVAYDEVVIYPTGLTKDTVVVPDVVPTDNMKTVLENDHIRMICLGFITNEDGELCAQYYVENKSDVFTTIELTGTDRMLNGQSYDTSWLYAFYLPGGHRDYVDIGFYHEEAAQLADITSPEQITSFEATVTLTYCDAEMNWHEDEYRLVY